MGPLGRTGIVTGLQGEAALIGKHVRKLERQPIVACRGPGPDNARRAAADAVSSGTEGLISFGFAGGIDETIDAGTVVLASEVRAGRQQSIATNDLWRETIRDEIAGLVEVVEEPIAASDAIVSDAAEKTRMRYQTGAVAVDMESLAVGEIAAQAGLPFLVIRAISDPALQCLPIMAIDAVDEAGRLRFWRILWSLIRHPGQLGELRRLAGNTRAASDALTAVCRLTAPDFCLPDFRGNLIRQLRVAGGSPS